MWMININDVASYFDISLITVKRRIILQDIVLINEEFINEELFNIYDEEKNGILATKKIAHMDEYLWWKCKRGHRYIAKLRSVISHKETGCMYCDREKLYYSPIGWSGMHI